MDDVSVSPFWGGLWFCLKARQVWLCSGLSWCLSFFFFLYQYMTVRQRAWLHFSGVLVLVCFYFGVALIAFLGSISIGHTWFLTGCVLMAGWWLSWKWSGRRRRREKTTHPAAVRTSRAKVSFAYAPKSCLSPGSIVIVTNSKPV